MALGDMDYSLLGVGVVYRRGGRDTKFRPQGASKLAHSPPPRPPSKCLVAETGGRPGRPGRVGKQAFLIDALLCRQKDRKGGFVSFALRDSFGIRFD